MMDSASDSRLADATMDVTTDDSASPDVGPRPTEPFGAPTLIAELSDPSADDDPTLTRDLLLILFNSNRGGNLDIWMSKRASTSDPWETPSPVDELNTPSVETTPELAPDGLTVWFASDRPGGMGNTDIYRATRASTSDRWSDITLVPTLSSVDADSASTPIPSATITTLGRPIAGVNGLLEARRASPSVPWEPAIALDLNDGMYDYRNGMLEADGLAVWFDTNRPDGVGSDDIYLALRPDLDSPFASIESVNEINSPDGEYDPWISEDRRHLYFVSRRSGDDELWEAHRP
jgi:hypothetical protein